METLFNFALKRAPSEQSKEFPSIPLELRGDFEDAIAAAQGAEDVRESMKRAAREYVASDLFIPDLEALEMRDDLAALTPALDELIETAEEVDHDRLLEIVRTALQTGPGGVLQGDDYFFDHRRLTESIFAIKLLPEEHWRPLHRLVGALRDLEVVGKVADDAGFPRNLEALRRFRQRSLKLPIEVDLPSVLRPPPQQFTQEPTGDGAAEEIKEQVGRFRRLRRAVDELSAVDSGDLNETEFIESGTSLPPEELRPKALFARNVEEETDLSGMFGAGAIFLIVGLEGGGSSSPSPRPDEENEGSLRVPYAAKQALISKTAGTRTLRAGRAAFAPQAAREVAFRLNEAAASRLSDATREILQETSLPNTALDYTVDALNEEIRRTSDRLDELGGRLRSTASSASEPAW